MGGASAHATRLHCSNIKSVPFYHMPVPVTPSPVALTRTAVLTMTAGGVAAGCWCVTVGVQHCNSKLQRAHLPKSRMRTMHKRRAT
jgi:hypothetical protein